MQAVVPKDLRDNLTRSVGYVRRDDLSRGLVCLNQALRQFSQARLTQVTMRQVERHIRHCLQELAAHPRVQSLLGGVASEIPYTPGREGALITVLEGLGRMLGDESTEAMRQQATERLERKKKLMAEGLQHLQEGKLRTGCAFLQRVAAEFGDEEGIRVRLAEVMLKAGQYREAGMMYESAMLASPRDARGYIGAVDCWLALKDYARAEACYQAVLRTFGGHPATFGRMASLYLAWEKPDKARDMAQEALKADAEQAEALGVLAALAAQEGTSLPEGDTENKPDGTAE